MTEDMYLSLAIELFEKGTWSKEVFIKKITLYAKEKNMDMAVIDEIIERLINPKEYTIEEKRKVLSFITISDDELKYGDAAFEMSDEMVEKFYEIEKESLDKDKFEMLHNTEETNNEVVEEVSEVIENVEIPEKKENQIKQVWDKKKEVFVLDGEKDEEIEVIGNEAFVIPVEIEESSEETFFWNKSIKDIIYGNYTSTDLLGQSDEEKEKIFNYLVENVKVEELRDVANSLINRMEPSYCLNFTLEWEKFHNEELKDIDKKEKEETKIEETTSNSMDAVVETYDNNTIENKEEVKQPKLVIPKLSFDSYGEDGLPTTEEEYIEQAKNITKTEKDSTVRKVNISPERLAKLKKTKDKAINCSLKTAMVILAFKLAGPFIGIGAVASYMYFAEEIKCGTFNPKNPVGKAIKYTVEKVMNIGIKKDKENERGKAK